MVPLSPALEAALSEGGLLDQTLMAEWWAKRPSDYRAHKKAAIKEVLAELCTNQVPKLESHT